MALERETAFFNENRQKWLHEGREGKWVVVHDSTVLGFYDTIEAGYATGVAKCGAGKFLLKQVLRHERVETIQRVHWGPRVQKAS